MKLKTRKEKIGRGSVLTEIEIQIRSIVLETYPLSFIEEMKERRRFKVFFQKGTVCVSCGKVGTQIIKRMSGSGSIHIDLYTDDLSLMTVDHICPKSKGGSSQIDNLQPMCEKCNSVKGNSLSFLGAK